MLDPLVSSLLRNVIDTPIKLQLTLLLQEQKGVAFTPSQVARRACRDIWSVRQALHELAEDNLLTATYGRDETSYSYQPRLDYVEPVRGLVRAYNDPMMRLEVHHAIREQSAYAMMRRAVAAPNTV